MTSATTTGSARTGGHRGGGSGYGLVFFAAILLLVVGFFNMIYGIAAIANSHVFVANAHYVVGNLRAWGWVTLIIAVLQLAAAAGVLAGNQLARWFAVAVLALNAIDMMFFVPAYPFWALTGHGDLRRLPPPAGAGVPGPAAALDRHPHRPGHHHRVPGTRLLAGREQHLLHRHLTAVFPPGPARCAPVSACRSSSTGQRCSPAACPWNLTRELTSPPRPGRCFGSSARPR
jgi:hypothetical protein